MSTAAADPPFVFEPPMPTGGDGDVVQDARREISQIVREVAGASRSYRSRAEFTSLLCDRCLRALAAEGVVLWQRDRSVQRLTYRCVGRLGRVTDRTIPPESMSAHDRLLAEIGGDGGAVVVPSTPGATDSDVPANPTHVPVAIASIVCDPSEPSAEYLIETFLESGGGVATQRGYLRFVVQMADLAGEFFRSDQLRGMRRDQDLAGAIDAAALRMHRCENLETLRLKIVDDAAELFQLDRVGLCKLRPKLTLMAVSHVNTIDQQSKSAQQIRVAAKGSTDADGCRYFANDLSADADASSAGGDDAATDDGLVLRIIAGNGSDVSGYRLVGLQAADAKPMDPEFRKQFARYTQHAHWAIDRLTRSGSLGASMLQHLVPASAQGWIKPLGIAAVGVTVLIAGMFPIPLRVTAPATIRPLRSQVICAHRDAVVDRVSVQHGDHVQPGDELLRLVDPKLDEQITSLVGRRAVLAQRQTSLTGMLVDTGTSQSDRMEQAVGQRSLVAEEIRSVDEQLAVLRRVEDSLVIRATQGGIVDGWKVDTELRGRPVAWGDPLLRLVANDSPWIAEARVPHNRIGHIRSASRAQETSGDGLPAGVCLDASPEQTWSATLAQVGPTVAIDGDPSPSVAVRFRLTDEASELWRRSGGESQFSGAPACVTVACGKSPAAYVLFQDAIESVRRSVGLYVTASKTPSPSNRELQR